MYRRLPTFLSLTRAATVGLFALTSVLLAQSPAPSGSGDNKQDQGQIKQQQDENAKLYKKLADEILRLAQRWEKSDNADEKARAKSLRAALDLASKRGVENLFKELMAGMGNKNPAPGEFIDLLGKDRKLIEALEEILTTLSTEDEASRLRAEIKKLEELIKAITELKRQQENIRARTENQKGDPDKIAKDQGALAKKTDDVSKQFPSQGGKDGKKNDGKDNANAGKPDDKSEAKPESKPGESKPESKPGMGDPKAQEGDAKPSDGKGKAGEGKPMSAKPSDGKPSDGKPMDGSPSPGSPGAGKPKPGGGGPPPKGGGGQPPPPGGPQQQPDDAQKAVEDAVPPQNEAEKNIKEKEPEKASKKQDDAIKKLEQALKDLERRLRQLREKELAKLLANLEERIAKMIRMQEEVLASTKAIDSKIVAAKGAKTEADRQKSQVEADKELAIISEAEKALKLMEGEGSAVVFAGVLTEVRGDMISVQKRLLETRVETQTQNIEEDIIEQLKMMKEALKKAQAELGKPSPPKPPGDGKPPDKKLIDLVNELKLIKSLQEQVNRRTIGYSKEDPGEQAKDALIQNELKQLSTRQEVLKEMLHKIATQANQ